MFSAGRIIAIDDEKNYLEQLTTALHGMGIPCIPICYPDQMPGDDASWFNGFRIFFCDLHLLPGAPRPELNYPVIGSLLERMTSPHGCPILLILWTAYAQDAAALERYLTERHATARPIAVFALSKADFQGDRAQDLPAAIRDKLAAIPQLRALYEWQDDVAAAGNACVGTLLQLARDDKDGLSSALDRLLSQLATAATGKDLAAENPAAAIHEALIPLLADGVTHLPDDMSRHARWSQAMPSAVARTKVASNELNVATVNTAMSVVHATATAPITGRERGAVIEVQCPSLFRYRFGRSTNDVIKDFALRSTDVAHRWLAIQVEAACDFAQQKSPSLPYVLALEVPSGAETKDRKSGRPDSVWESPIFLSETNVAVKLIANVRYVSMISSPKAKRRGAIYRLRDPIVNQLAFHRASQEIRPGIVALYP